MSSRWHALTLKSQFKMSLKSSAVCSHSRLFTWKERSCAALCINFIFLLFHLFHCTLSSTTELCTERGQTLQQDELGFKLNSQCRFVFSFLPVHQIKPCSTFWTPPPPKGVLSYSAGLSVPECLLSIYVSAAPVIKCSSTSILCQRWVYSGLLQSSVFFLFCFFCFFNWAPAGLESYN